MDFRHAPANIDSTNNWRIYSVCYTHKYTLILNLYQLNARDNHLYFLHLYVVVVNGRSPNRMYN